jgi:hypothetical protein
MINAVKLHVDEKKQYYNIKCGLTSDSLAIDQWMDASQFI